MDKYLSDTLLSIVASNEIVTHFELVSISENEDNFVLRLEEYSTLLPIELEGKSTKLNGFENKLEIHTFPLKGKSCYLHIYRRKWSDKDTGSSYSNNYTFHKTGMKATNELGFYLKKNH